MANLKWLYSLFSGNTEAEFSGNTEAENASINGLRSAQTRAFENNSQEFMFDSLMDVPFEPIDILWPRH
jgi:hypothetical protein